MKSLRELLLLMRFGQAKLSVAYHLQDIDRSKRGLAKAFDSYDAARAALEIFERDGQHRPPPPRFLLKAVDD